MEQEKKVVNGTLTTYSKTVEERFIGLVKSQATCDVNEFKAETLSAYNLLIDNNVDTIPLIIEGMERAIMKSRELERTEFGIAKLNQMCVTDALEQELERYKVGKWIEFKSSEAIASGNPTPVNPLLNEIDLENSKINLSVCISKINQIFVENFGEYDWKQVWMQLKKVSRPKKIKIYIHISYLLEECLALSKEIYGKSVYSCRACLERFADKFGVNVNTIDYLQVAMHKDQSKEHFQDNHAKTQFMHKWE